MDLEPTALVLVECRRRDGLPTLRRARIVACADGLVGVAFERDRVDDLAAEPGAPIGLSAPGRFGVASATVTAIDPHRRALVASVDAVVVALRDRRLHRRTSLNADLSWPTGAAAVVDVSPGGLLVAGLGPAESTPVRLSIGQVAMAATAHPLVRDGHHARLRFDTSLPELEPGRVIELATFAA